jgi:excisionase family DNA binding protein
MKRDEKLQEHKQQKTANVMKHNGSVNPADSSIQGKQFLSVKEAASLIGASSRTIQRLIAKGALKVGKVGRRSIIQRNEIDNLFQ